MDNTEIPFDAPTYFANCAASGITKLELDLVVVISLFSRDTRPRYLNSRY